jgi:hypothetical protein
MTSHSQRLPQEDWQYAIARINTGYISTIWPKVMYHIYTHDLFTVFFCSHSLHKCVSVLMRTYLSTHHRHSKPSTFAPLDSLPEKSPISTCSYRKFEHTEKSCTGQVTRSHSSYHGRLTSRRHISPTMHAHTYLHHKVGVGSILGSPYPRCYFGGCFTLHGKRGFHETKFSYWWWYRYLCCDGPANFARFDAGESSLLHLTAVPNISWPSP